VSNFNQIGEIINDLHDCLCLELTEGQVEWVVFNPQQWAIRVGKMETSRPYAYIGPDVD